MTTPKRVLFVSYQFPPVGGAGVQRVTKFVKYLPRHGWATSVLTVVNPSVPAHDASLVRDVPPATIVRRARTWEPNYSLKTLVSAGTQRSARRGGIGRRLAGSAARGLTNLLLQPDPQVLWLPSAFHAASRLLAELPHAAIVATGPPFSALLLGAALSRRTGIPLVLDYRDEWGLSNATWENKRLAGPARFLQTHMQRHAVRAARALVATTRSSAGTLEEVRAAARSTASVSWIYNGFDPDDFAGPAPSAESDGMYRLAYVGTLWNLTSVAPLVSAVEQLSAREPSLVARLELVFAGRRTAAQELLLRRLKHLPCRLVEHPYLDHEAAMQLVRSADGLCVLLADLPGAGRVVPAKLFEYLAARRPILAIAPRGEQWDLLEEQPAAGRFEPTNVNGIADWLAGQLSQQRRGPVPESDLSRYDRRTQAGALAAILNQITV